MPLYLAVKVSLKVAREEIETYLFAFLLTWSLLGVKESLSNAQISLL